MPDPTPNSNPIAGANPQTQAPPVTPTSEQQYPAVPAAPDASQLPVQGRAPAIDPVTVHHSMIGQAVQRLAHAIEGKQVTGYKADADGNLQPVIAPRKPGGIFRDILLGAVAGDAAASQAPVRGGAAGLAEGAAAGFQGQQDRQEARNNSLLKTAQQEQKNQTDKTSKDLASAAIAHSTFSALDTAHHINFHKPEDVSSYNNSTNLVQQMALDNGGILAKGLPANVENAKPGNGPALMQAFNKNPELMKGPDGYHRIPLITYDTSGLTWKPGQGYVDTKTGKPADMNSHATVSLVDLPEGVWSKTLTLANRDINNLAGYNLTDAGTPDRTNRATFGSLFGLHLKSINDLNEQRRALHAPPANDEEADRTTAQLADIKQRLNADPDSVTDDEKNLLALKQGPLDAYNAARQQREKQKSQQAVDQAVAIKKGEAAVANPRVPTSIGEASAAVTTARIAYEKDPSKDNAEKLKEAQQYLTAQRQAKTDEQLSEAKAKQSLDQADEDVAAKSLASGDPTALKDIASLKGDQRLRIFAKAKKLNPQFNTTQAKLKADTLEAYTNGKQADQIQSFGTFLSHAADASEVTNNYRTTKSPLINKSLNWIRKNATGDPGYSQFVTALAPVRDEFMTFLQNNHALTESDKKASDVIMSDNSSPAQIQEALKQMGNTAFIRLGQLNERYKRVMNEDFPDLLDQDAVDASNKLGLGKMAAKYRSGGQVTGARSQQPTQNTPSPSTPTKPTSHPFFSKFGGSAETN
ncbi:MAG TPA: hypothetical protein VFA74_09265 [Terriglobales bacterium]|nr:hypothetical protein [Terriglobales bacterium]